MDGGEGLGQGYLERGVARIGLERVACGRQGGAKAKGMDMVDTGDIWGDTDSEFVPLSEVGS